MSWHEIGVTSDDIFTDGDICPGIGIDDMFVILQCYRNLPDHSLDLAERIGLTMRHAGVAITVTSVTDILAFAMGSITVSSQGCIGVSFCPLLRRCADSAVQDPLNDVDTHQ